MPSSTACSSTRRHRRRPPRPPASSSRTRRRRGAGSAPTAQGYDIVSGPSSLPASDTVTPSGQSTYTWTTTSSDPRALQVPGSSNRVAAVWYSATSFTVDVNLADGQTHDLELYFLDWDNKGRSEQVQISDAATGTVLDTETISSFTSGVYLDWKVSGHLVITITRLAGANAVLDGLFLDPTGSGTASIGSLAMDRSGGRPALQANNSNTGAAIADFLGALGDVGSVASSGVLRPDAAGPAPRPAAGRSLRQARNGGLSSGHRERPSAGWQLPPSRGPSTRADPAAWSGNRGSTAGGHRLANSAHKSEWRGHISTMRIGPSRRVWPEMHRPPP